MLEQKVIGFRTKDIPGVIPSATVGDKVGDYSRYQQSIVILLGMHEYVHPTGLSLSLNAAPVCHDFVIARFSR